MAEENSTRQYDLALAAAMANPRAESEVRLTEARITITWRWDEGQHEVDMTLTGMTDEVLLECLFRAAIDMARR
jgi:hypothetical protein